MERFGDGLIAALWRLLLLCSHVACPASSSTNQPASSNHPISPCSATPAAAQTHVIFRRRQNGGTCSASPERWLGHFVHSPSVAQDSGTQPNRQRTSGAELWGNAIWLQVRLASRPETHTMYTYVGPHKGCPCCL